MERPGAGKSHGWAREMWDAGTYVFVVGAAISLLTVLTGLWDAWKSSEAGTQARRTINTHATIMVSASAAERVYANRTTKGLIH